MTQMMRSISPLNKVSADKLYSDTFSLAEIIEYAEFLGMDLQEDADLLFIAEEGVSSQPLVPANLNSYS